MVYEKAIWEPIQRAKACRTQAVTRTQKMAHHIVPGDDESLFPGEAEVVRFVGRGGWKGCKGQSTSKDGAGGRTQYFTRSDASLLHIYIPGMESHGIPGSTRT